MSEDGGSDSWCTPKWLCDLLGRFDLDPCGSEESHVHCKQRYGLDIPLDGLELDWDGSVFVNPPYSNPLPWARRLASHEGPWCALLKLDPSTKWWAALMGATPTVAPFRKRLKFERPGRDGMTANFPSVLIYSAWRPSSELVQHLWLASYTRAA